MLLKTYFSSAWVKYIYIYIFTIARIHGIFLLYKETFMKTSNYCVCPWAKERQQSLKL